MGTDLVGRARRLALPAGLAALAFLLYEVSRGGLLLCREVPPLRAVGLATLADRASQLKPLPWKAPWVEWAFGLYVVALATAIMILGVIAVRASLRDADSD